MENHKKAKRLSNELTFIARFIMTLSKLIPKKEVARVLGISQSTVVRWVLSGHLIEPFELGPNRTTWHRDELDNWKEEKKKHRGFCLKVKKSK